MPGGVPDAYLEGRFGWEFKGSDADLDGAMNQLLRYQVHLKTPPLLIVSSFNTIRIRTNFPGMETVLYEVPVAELARQANLAKLRNAFYDPDQLRPGRTVDQVTRRPPTSSRPSSKTWEQHTGDSEKLARYLKPDCVLPLRRGCRAAAGQPLLGDSAWTQPQPRTVRLGHSQPVPADGYRRSIRRRQDCPLQRRPVSNADTVELSGTALLRLEEATRKNWRNIEPSIFGTLFERALDASKRAHLGAHYTSAEDIMLVVEPVVMAPLRREWEFVQQEVGNLLSDGHDDAARVRLSGSNSGCSRWKCWTRPAAAATFSTWPCAPCSTWRGGNRLRGHARLGWPHACGQADQMLGLEIDPYATELARTALWIGYIQWHQNNGFPYDHSPILTPLVSIQRTDSILACDGTGDPREPEWPPAEFIVGNPPFLGHVPFREQLGDAYVGAVYSLYGDRIPQLQRPLLLLFEKARAQIADGKSRRAGLLATQAIRFLSNRPVLSRIKNAGEIFYAISDREWILDGAAVHISIVGFDDGSETTRVLDGVTVANINADLTSGVDLTNARRINDNKGIAFQGVGKVGAFDIPEAIAAGMLALPNPHGRPNSEVLRRWINGVDITQRQRNVWIIDFGVDMPETQAALYEAPFECIKENVMPERIKNKVKWRADNWWLHGFPASEMRQALKPHTRYIGTSVTAKHRFFAWLPGDTLPSNSVVAFARDDDYTFGVLHSRFHEVWALAQGTQLREAQSGIRYTPTTCFETFPFPEPTEEQREAVAGAARKLDELRQGWLNPTGVTAADLKKRTLTNLYNAYPTWLQNLHEQLDHAIAAAYGWPHDLSGPEMLAQLLMLNQQRAP